MWLSVISLIKLIHSFHPQKINCLTNSTLNYWLTHIQNLTEVFIIENYWLTHIQKLTGVFIIENYWLTHIPKLTGVFITENEVRNLYMTPYHSLSLCSHLQELWVDRDIRRLNNATRISIATKRDSNQRSIDMYRIIHVKIYVLRHKSQV